MIELGFIGTGNMGGALAQAAAKTVPGDAILLYDFLKEKAEALAANIGCRTAEHDTLAANARYIILGVKPQVLPAALKTLAPLLQTRNDRYICVSMAAGTEIAKIEALLCFRCPVIRIMPNMPAAIGQGMILCARNDLVSDGDMNDFLRDFQGAGRFTTVEERLIDAGSAVSGCGPAYACMFIEAMADGGVACGLSRTNAMEFAAQMLLGTAQMILESGKHPGEIKDAVCSPAGSTIAGVRALEQNGFRAACFDAVTAAYERTKELGQGK